MGNLTLQIIGQQLVLVTHFIHFTFKFVAESLSHLSQWNVSTEYSATFRRPYSVYAKVFI